MFASPGVDGINLAFSANVTTHKAYPQRHGITLLTNWNLAAEGNWRDLRLRHFQLGGKESLANFFIPLGAEYFSVDTTTSWHPYIPVLTTSCSVVTTKIRVCPAQLLTVRVIFRTQLLSAWLQKQPLHFFHKPGAGTSTQILGRPWEPRERAISKGSTICSGHSNCLFYKRSDYVLKACNTIYFIFCSTYYATALNIQHILCVLSS